MSCSACHQLDTATDGTVEAKERWNRQNDPSRFTGIELNYTLDELPTRGRAERDIWPSTYWATQDNSINVRWAHGELSPAEKYDNAFNGWLPDASFISLRPYERGDACATFDTESMSDSGPSHAISLSTWAIVLHGMASIMTAMGKSTNATTETAWNPGSVSAMPVPAAMLEDRPLKSSSTMA